MEAALLYQVLLQITFHLIPPKTIMYNISYLANTNVTPIERTDFMSDEKLIIPGPGSPKANDVMNSEFAGDPDVVREANLAEETNNFFGQEKAKKSIKISESEAKPNYPE
jgi:hypothetical protein